mgnify:CR=1 FL=1
MSAKTYNKAQAAPESVDVSHPEPFKPWTSFDSFYHEYCRKNGCNPKWKNMVEDHLRKHGWFNDQKAWLAGVKHFGI